MQRLAEHLHISSIALSFYGARDQTRTDHLMVVATQRVDDQRVGGAGVALLQRLLRRPIGRRRTTAYVGVAKVAGRTTITTNALTTPRARHPADGHARALTVTSEGVALATPPTPPRRGVDRTYFRPLANERQHFTDPLQRLAHTHP